MSTSLENISLYFPLNIQKFINNIHLDIASKIREIVICKNRPVIIYLADELFFISKYNFKVTKDIKASYVLSEREFDYVFLNITKGSPYSYEETVSKGYITLPTGERVGVCGNGFDSKNKSVVFNEINYLSFRILRDISVFPDGFLKYIYNGKHVYNTLVVSPPCTGKTTLLRDICRKLSTLNTPLKVGIIDEREEICLDNLWHQAVIMKGVSKTLAFDIFIRTLSPDVILTDEIGDFDDALSIVHSAKRGISIIASAHGRGISDVYSNPCLKSLTDVFETYIVLSDKRASSVFEKIVHKGAEVHCL